MSAKPVFSFDIFHALCTNNHVVTATIYLDSLSSSVPLLYALLSGRCFFKGHDVMSTISSYILLLSNLLSRRSRRINKLFMRLAAPQLNRVVEFEVHRLR